MAEAVCTGAVVAADALESALALGDARGAVSVYATMMAPPTPTAPSSTARRIRLSAGGSVDLLTAGAQDLSGQQ